MSRFVKTCPWNDKEVLSQILAEHHENIAAIILEPILANAGCLMRFF